MGWTFLNSPPPSPKKFLDEAIAWDEGPRSGDTVLRSAMVGGVHYAAMKRYSPDVPPVVWASVIITRRMGREWGYKVMDESMGPHCWRCPERILDMLSPPTSESAIVWRSKCRTHIAAMKALKPGADVLLWGQRLAIERSAGPRLGWVVRRLDDGNLFRVPLKAVHNVTLA